MLSLPDPGHGLCDHVLLLPDSPQYLLPGGLLLPSPALDCLPPRPTDRGGSLHPLGRQHVQPGALLPAQHHGLQPQHHTLRPCRHGATPDHRGHHQRDHHLQRGAVLQGRRPQGEDRHLRRAGAARPHPGRLSGGLLAPPLSHSQASCFTSPLTRPNAY